MKREIYKRREKEREFYNLLGSKSDKITNTFPTNEPNIIISHCIRIFSVQNSWNQMLRKMVKFRISQLWRGFGSGHLVTCVEQADRHFDRRHRPRLTSSWHGHSTRTTRFLAPGSTSGHQQHHLRYLVLPQVP